MMLSLGLRKASSKNKKVLSNRKRKTLEWFMIGKMQSILRHVMK
jgi:hypothetical protein